MCIPTNPEWTERIYVSIYNVRDKNTILGFGVGQYPNKNVQDGFATVWHEGRQYNFRASRTLRPRIDEVKIGPLSVETLEGLRRFRIKLDDNPSTLRLDIEWTASMNPHEEEHDLRESGGKVVQDIARFDQVGRARGTLQFGGKTISLTEDAVVGASRSLMGHAPSAAHRHSRTRSAPPSRRFCSVGRSCNSPATRCIGASSNAPPGKYSYFSGEKVAPFGETE